MFWNTTTGSSGRGLSSLDRMRLAEKRLLAWAQRFGSPANADMYDMKVFDTPIPRSVVPLKDNGGGSANSSSFFQENHRQDQTHDLIIHGVHVHSKSATKQQKAPLVLLHGYMNASAYFYRNLVGLTSYFQSVYSLDMLGWGLSSRPHFNLSDGSTITADGTTLQSFADDSSTVPMVEQFFVESLEAWRKAQGIPKMILAGHSMGGYMSVAYCEKYPQHVERLILISPVGVPTPNDEQDRIQRLESLRASSWRSRFFFATAEMVFYNFSIGAILRSLPERNGLAIVSNYVKRRLRAIHDPEEQTAISEYLYGNSILPGSGEYCLNHILHPNILAKKPTLTRIPKLKISSVSFLYGSDDWMDVKGGLQVQDLVKKEIESGNAHPPQIKVYEVSDAGHLLMLDNWEEFNAGMIMSAGGVDEIKSTTKLPKELSS